MPIYTALDTIQKAIVHRTIDETGAAPSWLGEVGDFVGYIEPPSYHHFYYDSPSGVRVRGQADLILRRADGKLAIVDLKTSRSFGRDVLLPTYHVQQNAYRLAAEAMGLGEVASISLLYMSVLPSTSVKVSLASEVTWNTCAVFEAIHHPLELDPDCVDSLCMAYRDLIESTTAPASREGCIDCGKIETICHAGSGSVATACLAGHERASVSVLANRDNFAKHLSLRR